MVWAARLAAKLAALFARVTPATFDADQPAITASAPCTVGQENWGGRT